MKQALNKIYTDNDPRLTFVFIHGLTGDPSSTWQLSEAGDTLWPMWLNETFPNTSAYTLGYSASLFTKWANKEMNIHELAENFLEHFSSFGISSQPLVIITHSLGGLLAKEILRVAHESTDESYQDIAINTKLVAFIATPHQGAAMAKALNLVTPKISSKHIKLLSGDTGYLDSLNKAYRDIALKSDIKTIAYYEKHATKKLVIVVSKTSADPGVSGCRPVPIEADHIDICKPDNKNDLLYASLCRHIKKILPICNPVKIKGQHTNGNAFDPIDYGTPSSSDRRDLLQKLIDANREHEYHSANNQQNKFAQRYYKHGLYTQERISSDELLAEVEQRFLTHVYQPKICKGATDDEVQAAIQENVVNALSSSSSRDNPVSASAILQALWFLTEQCHIQWDAK